MFWTVSRSYFPKLKRDVRHGVKGLVIDSKDQKVNRTICEKEQEGTFLYSFPFVRNYISTICKQFLRAGSPTCPYQLFSNHNLTMEGGEVKVQYVRPGKHYCSSG